MTDGKLSRSVALAALLGGMVLSLLLGSVSAPSLRAASSAFRAAQKKDTAYPKPVDEIKLIGASECKNCHDESNPASKEAYQNTQGFHFVRLWENRIWSKDDLHSLAFKNLTTNRTKELTKGKVNKTAQKMEDNLRTLPGHENYTVAGDTACLACHASVRKPIDRVPPAKWGKDSFLTRDGVGCEMCHGHGNAFQQKHRQPVDVEGKVAAGEPIQVVPWRTWPPTVKKEWGLVNLRDPAVAATRCASCHVGNKDDGRFVTHEMFAAGHPPLPPLDLMAYTRDLPRHWGLASKMPYLVKLAKKEPQKAYSIFHYRGDGDSLVVRRFVESTIGTLSASLALTRQLAEVAKKDQGLDFAAFDCYSCHHDLKYPSDRQARGYEGPPGRPQFRLAPFALARLVVDHAGGMEHGEALKPLATELDQIQKKLAAAFGNRTYGNPDAIAQAAKDIEGWCAKAQTAVQAVRYTAKDAQSLLAKIIEAAGREPVADLRSVPALQRMVADPEVAQLYVWAAETLMLEIANKPNDAPSEGVLELHKRLKSSVVTRLREAPYLYGEKVLSPNEAKNEAPRPVDERLHDRMKVFNSFQGEVFRKAFKNLPISTGDSR